MSVVETVLVFVGIPLLIVLVLAALVYGPSLARQPSRYRPGRPWKYEPSWFVPHPHAIAAASSSAPAIESAARPQLEGDSAEQVSTPAAVGGASGEW